MLMTDYNLITVSEFASYAPEVDTSRYDAPTISGMISQASKQVSDYLEYTPYAEDVVDELARGYVTTEGDLLIFPAKIPIQSVSAIAVSKGTVTIPLNLTVGGQNRYNIDYTQRNIRYAYQEISMQGQVVFTNFFQLRNTQFYTKISYRGGWEVDELPSVIKKATILFMRDTISAQYNPMGANSLRQGAVSFSFGTGGANGMQESKFLQDAKKLLNPYRRIK